MILRPIILFILLFFPALAVAQEGKTAFSAEAGGVDPNRPGYELILDAKLVADGATVERGMQWRVFKEDVNATDKLPLVATGQGGTASFTLNAGVYLVHASFGRASASKRVNLGSEGVSETFVLNAGGLQLNATSEALSIPPKDLRFSIYELEQNDEGERKLIVFNASADKVIPLNAGIYHVLSRYGTINATVRADLEVKSGELTKAVLQHRGAPVSLRLVSQSGGTALANTAWSVFTQDGEKVFQSQSVSPSLILAEGTYEASVRYGERTLQQNFVVQPGAAARVEIILE